MDSGIATGEGFVERRQRSRFVLRERRTGFDSGQRGPLAKALVELRDSPLALLALLAAVNVLNLLDQLATTRALAAGFTEGNPVMAGLIAFDPRLAAIVKLVAVAGVTAAVWRLRRYRVILQVALFMFALFAGVMLLHFYGSAFFF